MCTTHVELAGNRYVSMVILIPAEHLPGYSIHLEIFCCAALTGKPFSGCKHTTQHPVNVENAAAQLL